MYTTSVSTIKETYWNCQVQRCFVFRPSTPLSSRDAPPPSRSLFNVSTVPFQPENENHSAECAVLLRRAGRHSQQRVS